MENIRDYSAKFWPRWRMRPYHGEVAEGIVRSVERGEGRQFAVVFARQSGKDEMLAQLEAYLMQRFRGDGGSIIVASPTYRPHGMIARRRLKELLHAIAPNQYRSDGHAIALDQASCAFASANPAAQARGETATLLLACNEAQDVLPDRWDSVFDAMGPRPMRPRSFRERYGPRARCWPAKWLTWASWSAKRA